MNLYPYEVSNVLGLAMAFAMVSIGVLSLVFAFLLVKDYLRFTREDK